MYAVIRAGGTQTTFQEGETIELNRLPGEPWAKVVFDDVLLVRDDEGATVGRPKIEGAQVIGEIVAQTRGRKIRVFKFKRRKGYSRTRGHRQELTRVQIKEIKR
jgi:large subunit ribosomal protein L21